MAPRDAGAGPPFFALVRGQLVDPAPVGEDTIFLIQYGSSVSGPAVDSARDIDYYCVSRQAMRIQASRAHGLDMLVVPEREFKELVSGLDPLYATEPILTGRLVAGSNEDFEALRDQLQATKPTNRHAFHLIRRAWAFHDAAWNEASSNRVPQAMEMSRYGAGYFLFAAAYIAGLERPATLRELTGHAAEFVRAYVCPDRCASIEACFEHLVELGLIMMNPLHFRPLFHDFEYSG